MTFEWHEHTAEVELEVCAPTKEAVFADAADAFGRLVELEPGGEPARHRIEIEARDLPSLLVEWLQELIFLADSDSFVPDRVDLDEVDVTRLRAGVDGRRTAVDPLVKAATYHGLEFARDGKRWRARVVLDV